MKVLRETGPFNGFKVVELDRLLPEVVSLGERKQKATRRRSHHTEKHWLIFYVAEGTSWIRLDGSPQIEMKPCSVGWLPPGLTYTVQHGSESRHRVLWVCFELGPIENRYPDFRLSESLNGARFAHGLPHLEPYFLRLIREATGTSIFKVDGLRLAIDALLLHVARAFNDPRNLLSLVSVHPAISKALRILETNYKKNWTITELAREVELSRSRLTELFNQVSGYSIHRFLNQTRIRHAESLLAHSDLPIARIAAGVGFATVQHFSRVFKEINGLSPIGFRRQKDSEHRAGEPAIR